MVEMQQIKEVYCRLGILEGNEKTVIKKEINTGKLHNTLNTNYTGITNAHQKTMWSSGITNK